MKHMDNTLVVGSVGVDYIFSISPTFIEELPISEGTINKVNMTFIATDSEIRAGGTATNIAYSYLLLDKRIFLFSAVGIDYPSVMGDKLAQMGLKDRTVMYQQQTAHSYQITDPNGDQMIVWQPNAYSHIEEINLTDTMSENEIVDCKYAIFSPGTPSSTLKHMTQYRDYNPSGSIIFDPGQMINHYTQKQMDTCLLLADMLILNDVEFLKLCDRFSYDREKLIDLLDVLLITKGSEGVEIHDLTGVVSVPQDYTVKTEIEATGAGDSFRGAFLASILQGKEILYACRISNIMAGKSVEQLGAQLHEINHDEVMGMLKD